MSPIPPELIGEVWPAAEPGRHASEYGSVTLAPGGAFPVRSFQTFRLVYTVGRYGLDDTGGIKILHRFTHDGGAPQTSDPAAMNFVTAAASNGSRLDLYWEPYGHQRPWNKALRITVEGGFLRAGDTITVVYGDRSGGSPGFRLQTFCESAFVFRVAADPCATGQFMPLPEVPSIAIVPGPPELWKAVLPTLRRPGEEFALGIKAEDHWGNPTGDYAGLLRLEADGPVDGLPEEVPFPTGERALRIDGLRADGEGVLRIRVRDAAGGELCRSNPLVLRASPRAAWWGDLHGQSGETIGIGSIAEYWRFARDLAFLDVTSHQGNDFQIRNSFWDELNRLAAELDRPGRFVCFPGYEWSGNTAVGGDRNVFFRHEGRQIRRSSHALLTDRSDLATDAPTARHLFEALSEEDCVVWAHVGGRYADTAYAHDGRIETAVELHSDWGTFEWILTDALAQGHRVGVVCNSDGHKGRPGASYPGASSFGAYGGLTCFLADRLDRDAIFDCMRRRRHYGTSGCRMFVDVRAGFGRPAEFFARDPRLFDCVPQPVTAAGIGDIVRTEAAAAELAIEVHAHAPVLRIDVLNGAETVATLRPYGAADLGGRIRVVWQGAEYRGRGRETFWRGTAAFSQARITRMQRINIWNREHPVETEGARLVRFDTLTTGNFGGFDAWLADGRSGALEIETDLVSAAVPLAGIGIDDTVLEAGGLGRAMRICRLPDRLTQLDMQARVTVPLAQARDNPVWIRVTTEDGYNAWSSPIYIERPAQAG